MKRDLRDIFIDQMQSGKFVQTDSDKCAMKRYFGNYWEKLNMDWVLNNIKEVL